MKVFISWSGEESKAIAQVLRDELPVVINAIDPFVSSEDIEKGVPWFQNISQRLEESSFGIVCLSSSNLQSKWLYFEAGALAAKVSQKHVAPLLIGVSETAVKAPFSQFQLTKLERNDFLKLLLTINRAIKEKPISEETLKRSFEMWWPQFEKKGNAVIASTSKKESKQEERSEKEILEEILSIVRSMQRQSGSSLAERLFSTNAPQEDSQSIDPIVLQYLTAMKAADEKKPWKTLGEMLSTAPPNLDILKAPKAG